MKTYKQPMKNLGIIPFKKEKIQRYISMDELFEIIVKSLGVGIIIGIVVTLLFVKSI